jgi:hypothetical protein
MSDKPTWRTVYDRVADEVGPRLTEVTGSDGFAEAVEAAGAVRSRAATELQRTSRRLLHAWNLPAGSDITVLRQELGALNREVRTLARHVEALQRELDATRRTTPEDDSVQDRRAG